MDDANTAACRLIGLSELLSQLSPNAEVRLAAREAEVSIAAARARNIAREDITALVFAVYAKVTSSPGTGDLDAEDRQFPSIILGQYLRSEAGVLTDGERRRFRAAFDELSKICAAAQDTFIESEEGVWFKGAELDGIPEAALATMHEDGSRLQATFPRNHVRAVLSYATKSETRRRLTIAD